MQQPSQLGAAVTDLQVNSFKRNAMPIPFDEFRPIFPPHPAAKWRPEELASVTGYLAQYKYDDWRTLVYVFPDGEIQLYGRKKQRLARYRPPLELIRSLEALNFSKGKFQVLDGGLLHYKTERVKDTLVLWDVLVYDGQYLIGTNFTQRYGILEEMTGRPENWVYLAAGALRIPVGLQISGNLWLAPVFSSNFSELYKNASQLPEIEGLVLKDPNAPLQRAWTMDENATWMIRVRKPEVHYRF